MAGKTKPFVPMLISFNEEGYQIAQKQAEEKLMVLDEGAVWVNNQFCLEDSPINMRRFHNDMVEHFKDIVLHYNKDKNQLGLSATKLIEVKEIPIMGLLSIKERYEKLSVGSEVTFTGNVPSIQVIKKDFQVWSSQERQNKKIIMGNQMIKAINDLKDSMKLNVYPMDIQRATKGFIRYDIRGQKYILNPEYILA